MRSEWLPNICTNRRRLIELNTPIVVWSPCRCTPQPLRSVEGFRLLACNGALRGCASRPRTGTRLRERR